MPKIKIPLEITWKELFLLKEIEEKHYDSHKLGRIVKKIAERNVAIICKLWEYYKKFNGPDDIKDFIEKNW